MKRPLWTNLKERQRLRALKKITDEVALDYLSAPMPDPSSLVRASEYLALDFETTGLDPRTAKILSIGYTVLRDWKIVLGKSGHHVINVDSPLPATSVVIHQITDTDAQAGAHLAKIMALLLQEMKGRVLLVHFAPIERRFLNAAMKALYGRALPFVLVDTMAQEQRRLQRINPYISPSDLRLFNLRKSYGLPRYNAHNALEDAIATAELFLAHMAPRIASRPHMRLGEILG